MFSIRTISRQLLAMVVPSLVTAQTFRAMSWNIRWDSQPDNITIEQSLAALNGNSINTTGPYYPNTNERPWSARRFPLAEKVLWEGVTMMGFQEAVVRQVNDIQTLLGSEFDHRGVARADGTEDNQSGANDNELGPVFWKKSGFKLRKWDTFWLSDTPFDVGTKAPAAGNPRICTTAQFQAQSGIVTVLVTHWDDQSDQGREVGASLILHRANYEAYVTKRPVILLGDFNSVAVDLNTPGCNACTNGAYRMITGDLEPLPLNQTFLDTFPVPDNAKSFKMIDIKTVVPKQRISGNFATYTGFDSPSNTNDMKRIDFIMGGSNGGWQSESFKVGTNVYDDGLYISDHRPVFSDITLQHGNFPVV